jgi:hypothetical protein
MLRGGGWCFHRRLRCYVLYCIRLDIFVLCQFEYSWSIQKYIGTMPVSCLEKNKWAHVVLIRTFPFLSSLKLSRKGHLDPFWAKFITFQWSLTVSTLHDIPNNTQAQYAAVSVTFCQVTKNCHKYFLGFWRGNDIAPNHVVGGCVNYVCHTDGWEIQGDPQEPDMFWMGSTQNCAEEE